MTTFPLQQKTEYPHATLLKTTKETPKDGAVTIYQLELHNRPDNRLLPDFITDSILPALDDVERDWRADAMNGGGAAALVTHGPADAHRFYSNGLDLPLAMKTPMFFPRMLNAVFAKLLTFPIPTIAAINGHAFAGGATLALAHDFRIMKHAEGKGRAMFALNEIDFGANIPLGMMTILKAKITSPTTLRKVALEGQRILAPEALALGLVDDVAGSGAEVVEKSIKLGEAYAVKAKAQAWGLIKAGMYQTAVAELAIDRGNDGLGMHTKIGGGAKL